MSDNEDNFGLGDLFFILLGWILILAGDYFLGHWTGGLLGLGMGGIFYWSWLTIKWSKKK